MTVVITAKLDDDNKVVKKVQRIGNNSNLGMFLAQQVYDIMEQYTPMDTGLLYQNVVIEPFKITYTQPYAKRMYYGNDFNFNKEQHSNATHHWDRPAQIARGGEVADAVSRFLRSR